jgi:hypothetical protein
MRHLVRALLKRNICVGLDTRIGGIAGWTERESHRTKWGIVGTLADDRIRDSSVNQRWLC